MPDPLHPEVTVAGIRIRFEPEPGRVFFADRPVIFAWIDSTLAGLMSGLATAVGPRRFALAMQAEGRKSVAEDWQVFSAAPDFASGFAAIAEIAAAAGWGRWKLLACDLGARRLEIEAGNCWEGLYQRSLGANWGSGMTAGKFSGYATRLFGENCWAEQTAFIAAGAPADRFVVAPSLRSIEEEIEGLLQSDEATRADMAVAMRRLEDEISERRRTTAQLEIFKRATDASSQGFVVCAPDASLLYANPRVRQWLGADAELAGRLWPELLPEAQRRRFLREILPSLLASGQWTGEIELESSGKERLPAALDATTIRDAAGAPQQLILRLTDLRERKQAEAALIRSARLAAVGTLASGVAHEFNNINTSLLGFLQLAFEEKDLSARLREMLGRAIKAANRGRQVTDNLLAFTRRHPESMEMTDLNAVVRETLGLLETRLRQAGVTVELDLGEEVRTLADAAQLGQVLLNLILNAEHAMLQAERRTLTIRTRRLPAEVLLSVRDVGRGIPEGDLGKIFTPFFTTKGESAPAGSPESALRGTGLGLSVSQTILENHQGRIEVASRLGEGSTFTLVLPVREHLRDPLAAEPPARLARNLSGVALVVDDEPEIRDFLRLCLGQIGLEVHEAADGVEALDWLDRRRADLLLLDVSMPRMGARELLDRLRERSLPQLPRILLITGVHAGTEVAELRARVDAFLQKPVTVQDLLATIQRLLPG